MYDKKQRVFNIAWLSLTLLLLLLVGIFGYRIVKTQQQLIERVDAMEENQNFNFLQAPHHELEYQLTTQGFFIDSADDIGQFNGPSMQPTLFDGHLLIEKSYNGSSLEEGSIIRFIRQDGTAVIHRVRADYGDELFVQGDSLKDGEIIQKDQVTHIIIGVLFT